MASDNSNENGIHKVGVLESGAASPSAEHDESEDTWAPVLRPTASLSTILDESAAANIPKDIVRRLEAAVRSEWDTDKYLEMQRSVFGRLAHWHPLGSMVARLLSSPTFDVPGPARLRGFTDDDRRAGVYKLQEVMTPSQAVEVKAQLEVLPVYPYQSHPAISEGEEPMAMIDLPGDASFACYSASQVASLPTLLNMCCAPASLAWAASACQCVPTVQTLRVFWTFPGRNMLASSGSAPMYLHRDLNDLHQFNIYTYLTDAATGYGEHAMIPYTGSKEYITKALAAVGLDNSQHHGDSPDSVQLDVLDFFSRDGYQIDEALKLQVFESAMIEFTGPAGTAFGTDGFCFHQGRMPEKGLRLAYAIRYIMAPVPAIETPLACNTIPDEIIGPRIQEFPMLAYTFRHFLTADSDFRRLAEGIRRELISFEE